MKTFILFVGFAFTVGYLCSTEVKKIAEVREGLYSARDSLEGKSGEELQEALVEYSAALAQLPEDWQFRNRGRQVGVAIEQHKVRDLLLQTRRIETDSSFTSWMKEIWVKAQVKNLGYAYDLREFFWQLSAILGSACLIMIGGGIWESRDPNPEPY